MDNALSHEPHTIDSRKVEAKRAVPRSEISGNSSLKSSTTSPYSSHHSTPTASPLVSSHKSTATTVNNNNHSSAPTTPSSQHNQLFDSKHALDPKINMEEYAYNKIFVGGLHYDTRDGELFCWYE